MSSSTDLFEFVRFMFDNTATIVKNSRRTTVLYPGGHEVCLLGGGVGNGDDGQLLDLVFARPQ